MKKICFIFLYCTLLSVIAEAQLKLDSTFNTNGIKLDFLNVYDHWNQIIVEDNNGDYIVAGTDGISKMDNNGSVVTQFGNNGTALFPYDTAYSWYKVVDVKLQRDGKIVVLAKSPYIFALMRYNTNGTIDNSFNGTGIITESLGAGMGNIPRGLAIDTYGDMDRIYVVGSHGPTANNGTCAVNFFVCKFNPDGSYDNSFHQNGQWIANSISTNATTSINVNMMMGVHIISENNIIVTGNSPFPNPAFIALKMNKTGVLNSTFGTNGYWQHASINNYHFQFKSYAFGKDKLLLSLNRQYNTSNALGSLVCLDTLGQAVSNFGFQGEAIYGFGGMYKPANLAIDHIPTAVDKDKNIYVALYSMVPNSNSNFRMVKLDSTGNIDPTFGTNSVLQLEPFLNDYCPSAGNFINDIKVTSDNKLVLAYNREGTATIGNYQPGTGVYRYQDINYIPTLINDLKILDISIDHHNGNVRFVADEIGDYDFKLYNINGVPVFSTKCKSRSKNEVFKLKLPELPAGHYIATLYHKNRKKGLKIILR